MTAASAGFNRPPAELMIEPKLRAPAKSDSLEMEEWPSG